MPQVTGKLTHDKYWGAVIMVVHASNFSYSCMIKGTTIEETAEAKAAYKRILHEYGHKVEAYYSDNSRFDSADFQTA
eukprot:12270867-Ditylum_brightwellii.AAC.1